MTDPVVRGYATTPDGQVHLRRVDGPGPPIVLLHRTPSSSVSFDQMLRLMAGRRLGFALDTPGFGQSFAPAGMPTTIDYARWFLAALNDLDVGDFHLCAHHTGTHFAAEMALLAPDRVRSLLLNGVLYLDAPYRADMLAEIGPARRIDVEGDYLTELWRTMRKLVPDGDAELIHAETVGALAAIDGRDQAFGAICAQDFAGVLARVTCPVAVVQAEDDPLGPMLYRLRGRYPTLSIRQLGPAYLAAPERQPNAYADAALAFADRSEQPRQEPAMSDRRFTLVRNGDTYDLHQTSAPCPTPGPGEVLIGVRAVSLNRRDISIRDLSYPVGEANHFTPLSDASGEVLAVGEGVTAYRVGDRVCSTFFQNWESGRVTFPAVLSALGAGGPGVLADRIVLEERGIAHVPDGWSWEEAACVACAGVTAWSGLMPLGKVQNGDWVLVIGTGGVAVFALQIAVAAGARVVMLSSSDDKLAKARAMGAEVTINYATTPNWSAAVKKATDGGVHHAIELGGVGTLEQSLSSMTTGGHVALIGALAGFGGDISCSSLIMAALRVSAVVVGSHQDHLDLTAFLVEHEVRPVIDSMFGIDEVETAYARAAAGAFGKVVIRMEGGP